MESQKILKAIFINVESKTIELVDIEDSLQAIYNKINCDSIDTVRLPKNDCVYVDGEGLLNLDESSKFFLLDGYPSFLAGNGLVLGLTGGGYSADVNNTLDDIKDKVRFFNIQEIAALYPEWLNQFI